MNSPQSQKLAVGSTVKKYTTVAMAHTVHPVKLLRRSKRMQIFVRTQTTSFASREGRTIEGWAQCTIKVCLSVHFDVRTSTIKAPDH